MKNRWLEIVGGLVGTLAAVALLYGFWSWSVSYIGSLATAERKRAEDARGADAGPTDARPLGPDDVQRLYADATEKIDSWHGRTPLLLQAQRNLHRILQANPRHALAYVQLARVEYKLGYLNGENFDAGGLERAHRLLAKAFEIDPELVDAFVVSSSVYYFQKDLARARQMAEEAEKREPSLPDVNLALARIERKEQKLDDAFKRFRAVIETTNDKTLLVTAYEGLISIHKARKEYAAADEAYQVILKLEPDSAWAKVDYANFLVGRGEHDKAIEFAKAALGIMDFGMGHRVLADAYAEKGRDLFWTRNEPEEAARYFHLAIQADPSTAGAHYGLGAYYFTRARTAGSREQVLEILDQAEREYRRALELEPDYAAARQELDKTRSAKQWVKSR